jgi:hypothetical protein
MYGTHMSSFCKRSSLLCREGRGVSLNFKKTTKLPRLGVEPRVEAFCAWAEGVFLGLSAEEKEIVPQAVLKIVWNKWKSQDF